MYAKWEEERMTANGDFSDTEGALDLSMPKKFSRSDSSNSSMNSEASSSMSSKCSVDNDQSPSDPKIFKMDFSRRHEFGDFDEIQSTDKGRRLSDSPIKEETSKGIPFSPDTGICSDLDINEFDEQPITCSTGGITLGLHDANLWNSFRKLGTEMIINRGGRRMFPHVVLSVSGLNPSDTYSIFLEIVQADDRRFKYINDQWMGMGMADPSPGTNTVVHSDSPNAGSFWMQTRISFSKVRLTNNKDSSEDNILLLSMHKYKVVIKIRNESTPFNNTHTFTFDESAFLAVTAYQNNKITKLKIQNNPFAKAFRDGSNKPKGEGKRKHDGQQKTVFNDYSAFQVSSHKKSKHTSPLKEMPEPHIRMPLSCMTGLGSGIGTGYMPRVPDFMTAYYEGMRHPGMYMNPAMMAQWPYFPFYPMANHLRQPLLRSDKVIDSGEQPSRPSSPADDAILGNSRRDITSSPINLKSIH